MRVEPARWRDWEAVRLVAGDCELVVGVSAGPRILSLRHAGGPNLLQHDTTPFTVGNWRRHGGHRFTVAPEEDRSYEPDNEPCSFAAGGAELRVNAPPRTDGIACRVIIRTAADGAGFDLDHILENRGRRRWRGAAWAITCVPAIHPVVAPRTGSPLRFWPRAEGWQPEPGYVTFSAGRARGKAGWHSEAGWLASLQPGGTLVIHAPDVPAPHACVDGGCNVELYTSADCTELETLGGQVDLGPGARTVHRQRWRVLPPGFTPPDWAEIGAQAGCTPASTTLNPLS